MSLHRKRDTRIFIDPKKQTLENVLAALVEIGKKRLEFKNTHKLPTEKE